MDELQQEYKDKIDFMKFDLQTNEGYCEFTRTLNGSPVYGFQHIPAMLFYAASGRLVEKTEEFLDKDQLRQKLDNLVNLPPENLIQQP